ncbi:hypothetical protein E0H22_15620 [Rhodopseudomonas boonkerdii]|uniref:hypothetical protein n=1 Tax=Rhodopseudomonas boonkerdii TaxID=475937 RepID=UPI001E48F26C|nr:hypothetical protein [Rhodopseudomonas boonkerdii]UGV26991.1 hypothetical protein E0H22_15620 [Rhodopseudomonas boonkerdii]
MQTTKPSLFIGYSSERAIPVRSHLHRDFLVQTTFDGAVRRIEFHPSLRIDDTIQRIDALIVDSDYGRHAIDLVEDRPPCDPTAEGLMHLAFAEGCTGIMTVTSADIRREPRFTSARAVWRRRADNLHVDDREAVLGALEREGPLQLRALSGLIHTRRGLEAVIHTMACEGSVVIDLSEPLDDRAVVRAGMRPMGKFGRLAYGT